MICGFGVALRAGCGIILGRIMEGLAMLYQGSCHCGQIAFKVEAEFTTGMECN